MFVRCFFSLQDVCISIVVSSAVLWHWWVVVVVPLTHLTTCAISIYCPTAYLLLAVDQTLTWRQNSFLRSSFTLFALEIDMSSNFGFKFIQIASADILSWCDKVVELLGDFSFDLQLLQIWDWVIDGILAEEVAHQNFLDVWLLVLKSRVVVFLATWEHTTSLANILSETESLNSVHNGVMCLNEYGVEKTIYFYYYLVQIIIKV